MEFSKSSGGGAWLDKSILANRDLAKLVTEAVEIEGQNGKQVVAKIRIKSVTGKVTDAQNVAINNPSKNALIDAFGKDSTQWVNKPLMIHIEKTMIAGKRGLALYLVPEGFEVTEDAGGYVVVARKGAGAPAITPSKTIDYPKEEINPDDIPF